MLNLVAKWVDPLLYHSITEIVVVAVAVAVNLLLRLVAVADFAVVDAVESNDVEAQVGIVDFVSYLKRSFAMLLFE